MTKKIQPEWMLSPVWGILRNDHNWTLYRKSKNTWQPAGYYPSAELLLISLYRKLSRSEPADPDLIQHLKTVCDCVQTMATGLFNHIATQAAVAHERRLARGRNK